MRTLSTTAIRAMLAERTGESARLLLRIFPYGETDPANAYRLVQDNEDLTSNGLVYTALGFDLTLPQEDGDSLPSVNLEIDNVGQDLAVPLVQNTDPLTVELEIVLKSEPDTVLAGPWQFLAANTSVSAQSIALQLRYEDMLNEAFPCVRMTPENFPGLFQR